MAEDYFEQFYRKEERQDDLKIIADYLLKSYEGKKILELGCGSGYWTRQISQTAKFIQSIDRNQSLIDYAKSKLTTTNVDFIMKNFWDDFDTQHTNIFIAFILSIIPFESVLTFMTRLKNICLPQAHIILLDSNYVKGSNRTITYCDHNGNTYNDGDGSGRVLKNYYSQDFLKKILNTDFHTIKVLDLKYYWLREIELINNG